MTQTVWAQEADDVQMEGDFQYQRLRSGIVITKYRGSAARVTIPERIGGDAVQAIGTQAFAWNPAVERVELPDTVQFLGLRAFIGCRNLEEIDWPAGLLGIGLEACKDCTSLQTVVLPPGALYLSESAFSGCTALEEVVLPRSVYDVAPMCFLDCVSLKTVTIFGDATTGPVSAEDAPFSGCESLTDFAYGGTLEALAELVPLPVREQVTAFLVSQNEIAGTVEIRGCLAPAGDLVLPEAVSGMRVASIGPDVFGADSGFDRIFYEGTQAQWDRLSIGEGNTLIEEGSVICLSRDPAGTALSPCWNAQDSAVAGISLSDLAGMPLRGLDLIRAHWTEAEPADPDAPQPGEPEEPGGEQEPGQPEDPQPLPDRDGESETPRFGAEDGEEPDADEYTYSFWDPEGQQLGIYDVLGTGCRIVREISTEEGEPQSAVIVLGGDVLGTGVMNVAQVVRLAEALSGQEPLEGVYAAAGDLDSSGQIDIGDLTREAAWLTAWGA